MTNSRTKGANYERKIAKRLSKHFGLELCRTPLSGGMDWKGDILPIFGEIPYHIECKKIERFNIWKAIAQAERDCPEEKTPIVIFSRNRTEDYVCIKLEDFLKTNPLD